MLCSSCHCTGARFNFQRCSAGARSTFRILAFTSEILSPEESGSGRWGEGCGLDSGCRVLLGPAAKQTEESKETHRFPLAPASSTQSVTQEARQDWRPPPPPPKHSSWRGLADRRGQRCCGTTSPCSRERVRHTTCGRLTSVCVFQGARWREKVTVYNSFPVTEATKVT